MREIEANKNVGGKTPEEIKKSLKTAINGCMLRCGSCVEECSYGYYCGPVNVHQLATAIPKIMVDDALALIEQLELQNALLTAEKYLNNEFRNRIKKAQFATLINLMGGESPKEHYAIVKNNIAYKLAEFLLKEGAIVFCEVYSNHCEMEEIVGTIEIVMPEPPKEE